MLDISERPKVLVHVASGIGNIIFTTPLLKVLHRSGFTVDLLVDADYKGVAELFDNWSVIRHVYEGPARTTNWPYDVIVPAIPPFYWNKFARHYRGRQFYRPTDELFFRDEQKYYLDFARALGCKIDEAPYYEIPITVPITDYETSTLVLAPGSKPAEMAAKRWPFFPELSTHFKNVSVVGTVDDLVRSEGSLIFPPHVKSLVGKLTIRETAEVLATARAVVANDSGLGHLAAAVGVPTILIFGPTSHETIGKMPPNVTILRAGLPCEPCWLDRRLDACAGALHCLHHIDVNDVLVALTSVAFE